MKREAVVVVAAMALGLSACQTTGTGVQYVKVAKGPALDVATAECKAYAAKASHLVIGIGGPEAILLGAIATAAATAAKRAHVFEQCMALQGYRKADAKAAPQPAPQPPARQAPAKSKTTTAKPTPAKPAPAPKRAG